VADVVRRAWRRVVGSFVCWAALAIAGCGGSGNSDDAPSLGGASGAVAGGTGSTGAIAGNAATAGTPNGNGGTGSTGGSSGGTGGDSGSIGGSTGGAGASTGGTGGSTAGTGASTGGTGASIGGTGASSGGTGASSGGTGASIGGTRGSTGGTAASIGGTGGSTGGTGGSTGGTGASIGGTGASIGGTGGSTGGAGGSSGGTGASTGGTGVSSGGTGVSTGGTGGGECPEGWTGPDCLRCVVYVDIDTGNNTNDGRTWATAKRDLQQGIDAAEADAGKCHVWVAEGTYVPTYKPDPFGASDTATLRLPSPLGIYGGFTGGEHSLFERDIVANPTIISGEVGTAEYTDNLQVVVTAAYGGTLDGVTVRDGNPGSGALRCDSGALLLTSVVFENNRGGPAVYAACAVNVSYGTFSGNTRAIHVTDGALTIDNSTFVGAELGAVEAEGDLFVTDSVFEQNVISVSSGVAHGAAIQASGATTVIEGCRFTENEALYTGDWNPNYVRGGALDQQGSGSLVVRGCLFERNSARSLLDYAYGGALSARGGDTLVEDTVFAGNAVYGEIAEGGALHSSGSIRLLNTSFTANVVTTSFSGSCGAWLCSSCDAHAVNVGFEGNSAAGVGGAVCLSSGTATLANAAFAANTAGSRGGAVFVNGTAARFHACTFYGNTAGERGGGLFVANEAITVANSILWANQAGIDGNQGYVEASGSTTMTHSNMQGSGFTGENGNIDRDPRFVSTSPGSLDLRLQFDSPCIDTGDATALPPDTLDLDGDADVDEAVPLDLRSEPRVTNGAVDMGAYEYQP